MTTDKMDGFSIPERALWLAVLARAITDASVCRARLEAGTPRIRIAYEQLRALDWLQRPGRDFRLVCELAGLEPEYVARKWRAGEVTPLDTIRSRGR